MAEPRLRTLLVAAALVATPAAALQWRCGPGGCGEATPSAPRVPFCGLPADIRDLVTAGYRADRSPDVIATTPPGAGVKVDGVPWPSIAPRPDAVPLAFLGGALGGRIEDGITLDDVAPTLARSAGFDRPFPSVRSGRPLEGATPPDRPARLLVVVAWKGIGAADVTGGGAAARAARSLFAAGAWTDRAGTGSLPLDPTAVLTTIGTGGLPSQHGVTGSIVRGDDGVAPAFGPSAPIPVIATLAEDLDEAMDQRARVALVATSPLDRGLIGGDWYPDADRDDVVIDGGSPVRSVARFLTDGYGQDRIPDVIAVSLVGPLGRSVAVTDRIASLVGPGTIVAVMGTGTGSDPAATTGSTVAEDLVAALGAPAALVEGIAGDGLFLDPAVAARADVGAARAADAVATQTEEDGDLRFADAAPGFSVDLAGYC